MLKNAIKTLLIILTTTLFACSEEPNEQIDEGKIEGKTYSSKEIGWTIEIPDKWEVVDKDILLQNEQVGKEALEQVAGEVDISGLKHLISFKKDQFNLFQSTSERFEIEFPGEWETNNENVKAILYNTIVNQGINIDTSSSEKTIGGVDFKVFYTSIYGPNGEVILNQEMYSSYINGFDFSAVLSYNNETDRLSMMEVWESSTFKK